MPHPHRLGIPQNKRNLLITAELEQHGIPAVPNIYWFRLEDLDRYLVWLDDVRPGAVAVNLQTFRTEVDWEGVALPGLTYLSIGMPAGTKLVVTGSSRPDRIRMLKDLFGDRRCSSARTRCSTHATGRS